MEEKERIIRKQVIKLKESTLLKRPSNNLYAAKIPQMTFVFPKDYIVTQTDSKDVQFSQEETFLYTERGCSYQAFFEHHLQRQGIQHESTFEFWSIEAIKQCVMCGLGISLLPMITIRQEQKDKKLQAVISNEAKFATQLAYHKNKWISPALYEFLAIIRKYAEKWREVQVQ